MKRLITNILTLVLCLTAFAQTPFERANEQYTQGNYDEAVKLYIAQLSDTTVTLSDRSKAYVLYNLGDAYFRQNELAKSILSYERALRLAPDFDLARQNLEFAQSRIVDNIEDKSNFFLRQWINNFRHLLTTGTWMWLSIALFVLALTALLVFFFAPSDIARKLGFHTAWVALLLSAITLAFAARSHSEQTDRSQAIVTQGIVNVKSSPDRSGTDLFVIHEGTKVQITDRVGEWLEIHVGDNIGWLRADYVEVI